TDAGVHARGQVASFQTDSSLEPVRLQQAVNGRFGPEVVVTAARYAPAGFDARFSASAREYIYGPNRRRRRSVQLRVRMVQAGGVLGDSDARRGSLVRWRT